MAPLKVFTFSKGFGLPTVSPFALKLLFWLELADIDYEVVDENDPRKGPKGKIPWVEIEGELMGDTELIIARLSREHDIDLDAHLPAKQRSIGRAVMRMMESKFNQVVEYQLFLHHAGWESFSTHFDRNVPALMRPLVTTMVRSMKKKQLAARGIGRHSAEEIAAFAIGDLQALRILLDEGPYLFGDKPTLADTSIFGHLAVLACAGGEAPVASHIRSDEVLRAYYERILQHWFSDGAQPQSQRQTA